MALFTNKYDEMTDQELCQKLRGSKRESEQAFVVIYSRFSQKIYGYILKLVEDANIANDIYQEVFYKFYETIQKDKSIICINAFLMKIARNLCFNYKRDVKYYDEYFEDYSPVIDKSMDNKDITYTIEQAITFLDDEEKELVILRIYNGYTYKEIADLIGEEDIALIRTNVFRAKEKLRKYLQPYLDELKF